LYLSHFGVLRRYRLASIQRIQIADQNAAFGLVAKDPVGRDDPECEQAREQILLIIGRPIAGEAEVLLQAKHRFETRDGSTCRAESLKSADLRHVFLYPQMVALDALMQMLGDTMNRARMYKPMVDCRLNC